MAKLTTHSSANTTKFLVCGYSGMGKTGALAALAAEGYKLRIWDFDNGLDILKNLLVDPNSVYFKKNPKAIENVEYLSFWSKAKNTAGKLIPKPDAWQHAVASLEDWCDYETVQETDAKGVGIMQGAAPKMIRRKVPGTSLGSVWSWGGDVVFVIDSFSGLNDAGMEFMLGLNARLGQGVRESDWGDAQQLVWELVEQLTSPEYKCNMIFNCHIKDVSKENEPTMLMPNALGKKLPKDIPTRFNSILELKQKGPKRMFITHGVGGGQLPIKTSAPGKVKPEYDIEWGLAEYFKAVRSAG